VEAASATRGAELADLVEEFAAKIQAGEVIDPESFAAKHPDHADDLRRLLPAALALVDVGQAVIVCEEPRLPWQLGDFRLLREVGRGGMGIVYEATQISLDRRVALKVLPSAAALDERHLQRFKNEAQAAALLQHPHIVPVIAVGHEQLTHYYAMQFIDGESLAAVIDDLRNQRGRPDPTATVLYVQPADSNSPKPRSSPFFRLSEVGSHKSLRTSEEPGRTEAYFREVARLVMQAAEALDHAHQGGVIHRDVKPANLLLDVHGDLWVTDFGLARLTKDAGLTGSGDLLGTVRYMSPEQAATSRIPVDHRTDIYSLGVTAYELLTLEPAFAGSDRPEILRRIASEEPMRPRRLNSAVPADLEAIVLKAMEKAPADRYVTAADLADDLRRFLEEKPIRARRPTPWVVARKWVRRHAGLVAASAVAVTVVLLILAGSVTLLMHRNSQLREREKDLEWSNHQLQQQRDEKEQALRLVQREAERAKTNGLLVLDAFEEATLTQLSQQLKTDPKGPLSKITNKLLEQAVTVYKQLAKAEDDDLHARLRVVKGFLRIGGLYAELIRDGKGELVEPSVEQADLQYAQAIELAEKLVADQPMDWDCRFLLARAYRRRGDLCKAASHYKEGLADYEKSLGVWHRSEELSACPVEAALAHAGVSGCQEALGNKSEAVAHLRQALDLLMPIAADKAARAKLPADSKMDRFWLAQWHRQLGSALLKLDQPAMAEAEFREACKLGENLVKHHGQVHEYKLELALSYFLRAGMCEAVEPSSAEKFYKRSAELWSLLAKVLSDDGRFGERWAVITKTAPGSPSPNLHMAEIHFRLGVLDHVASRKDAAADHFREARQLYTAVVDEAPEDGPAPVLPGANENSFAWFLAVCPDESFRDAGRAVELAQKAISRLPVEGDYWNTRGAALLRAGKAEAAVSALEKAVQIHHGDEATDWFLLALTHQKLGQMSKARDCYLRGSSWLERHKTDSLELRLLRAEAASLLGIPIARLPAAAPGKVP
jgi:serine/threonine protein kinase/tetratricopeptide (TPR) repeat protein